MFQTPSPANSHSNYQYIFDSALEAYKKKTGKDLTSDPLLRRLETCHSPDDILVILREHISGFDHPHNSSDGLTKCLNPTVNVLYTFSSIIGASPGLVSLGNLGFCRRLIFIFQPFPPAAVIFTGIGILLSASVFDLISFPVLM
jgi:hypothetical protein